TLGVADSVARRVAAGRDVSDPVRAQETFRVQTVIPTRGDIRGTVFEDRNADGVANAGEAISGAQVTLVRPGTTTTTAAAVTRPDGSYEFLALLAGTYQVTAALPSGFVFTTPAGGVHTVQLTEGSPRKVADFGAIRYNPHVGAIALSPGFGLAGSQATVQASDFTPGATVARLAFGDMLFALPAGVTFSSAGAATFSITVPASAQPGLYPVRLTDSAGVSTAAEFRVLSPAARFDFTATPDSVPAIRQTSAAAVAIAESQPVSLAVKTPVQPGQASVVFTVIGLPQGATVAFNGADAAAGPSGLPTFAPPSVPSNSVQTTAMTVRVPSSVVPGSYDLTVRAHDAANPGSAIDRRVSIKIEPPARAAGKLAVSPASAEAGDPLALAATGFAANEAPAVTFGRLAVALPAGTRFDSNGALAVSITVPPVQPGIYPVTIADSTRKASADVQVVAGTETFTLKVAPAVLPAAEQGGTSQAFQVSVAALPGKVPPAVRINVAGLGQGMTALWSRGADNVFTTLSAGNPLVLQPGIGEVATASIRIATADGTQPAAYVLNAVAEGQDPVRLTKTADVSLKVRPRVTAERIPSLVSNPDTIRAGFAATLSGTDFVPSSTLGSVSLAAAGQPTPATLALPSPVTVGADGRWSSELLIPSTVAPGVYLLTATTSGASSSSSPSPSSSSAQARITVTAAERPSFDVDLSSDALTVPQGSGASVTMTAKSINQYSDPLSLKVSGLPAGMTVRFADVGGSTVATFTGTTSGTEGTGSAVTPVLGGSLPFTATVSAGAGVPAGTYSLLLGAEGPDSTGNNNSNNGGSAAATVTTKGRTLAVAVAAPARPALVFSPAEGQAGSKVSVLGSGFVAGEQVALTFGQLAPGAFAVVPSAAAIQASPAGTITAEFTVPSVNPGIYEVGAKGALSGRSALAPFKVIPTSAAGTVTLKVAPAELIIPVLSQGTQEVTVSPIGAFSSTVTLRAAGVAPGVGVSFLPGAAVEVTTGIPTKVSMVVSSPAAPVVTNVVIEAVDAGTGQVIASERVGVRVTQPSDFIVSAVPSDLLVNRGTGVSSTLRVVTVGVAGTPTPVFSVSGLPAGISAAVTGATPLDAGTGIATATLTIAAAGDAATGTSQLTLTASVGGLAAKTLPLSLSVVTDAPEQVGSVAFDPTLLDETTPLELNVPFQGDSNGLVLLVESLITSVYGASTVEFKLLSNSPSELGALPAGATSVQSGASSSNNIVNMEPSNPASSTSFDVCMTLPPLPAGFARENFRVSFLDTRQTPPVWTFLPTVPSSTDPNVVCAQNVNHFSSWALLAISPAGAGSGGGGGGGGGGSHSSGSGSSIGGGEQHQPGGQEIIEHEEFLGGPKQVRVGIRDGLVFREVSPEMPGDINPLANYLGLLTSSGIALTESIFSVSVKTPAAEAVSIGDWTVRPAQVGVDPIAKAFAPAARVTLTFEVERGGRRRRRRGRRRQQQSAARCNRREGRRKPSAAGGTRCKRGIRPPPGQVLPCRRPGQRGRGGQVQDRRGGAEKGAPSGRLARRVRPEGGGDRRRRARRPPDVCDR
ncbi:SdrD B-like domain-containing protein, partial [Nitrososphaera sp.]|uniref:SdrD B-like domain-containing protein n=1 Tax=Nitrososphaera sp. TaxID=1971748 RepID=UPI00307D0E04